MCNLLFYLSCCRAGSRNRRRGRIRRQESWRQSNWLISSNIIRQSGCHSSLRSSCMDSFISSHGRWGWAHHFDNGGRCYLLCRRRRWRWSHGFNNRRRWRQGGNWVKKGGHWTQEGRWWRWNIFTFTRRRRSGSFPHTVDDILRQLQQTGITDWSFLIQTY